MIRLRRSLWYATACVLAIGASAAVWHQRPVPEDESRSAFFHAEQVRLRAHFAQVEGELRSADVTALTPAQRGHRTRGIEALHEYAARGVFPHNHTGVDRSIPIFVDPHGTHCAMAFLIARFGGESLVRRVAATHNTATIGELADEPGLMAWLGEEGLTVAEAARIQPTYGGHPRPLPSASTFRTVSAVGAGVGSVAVDWNLVPPQPSGPVRAAGILGVTVGLVDIGIGFLGARTAAQGPPADRGLDAVLAGLDLAIGSLSAITGHRTLAKLASRGSSEPRASVETRARWSVSPAVYGTKGRGLQMSVRF